MNKNRLEAFSDGVLAIIITIMVLEIKIPHSASWEDLYDLLPVFLSYVLSYLSLGMYWGNHHHLMHTVKKVSAGIMWSNMNLLFWLSLMPFATGWMGENHFAQNTIIVYALLQVMCAISYRILQKTIESRHKIDPLMAKAHRGQARKGLISLAIYSLSIVFAFFAPFISGVLFFVVAILWIIPDKNIERALSESD
ncbi:MAG: DUF1211 domain-containing protein [Haliscomenobacteraceae bacterium CHB4]|nr:DUF1211 domain-containing protein [Haliscomenobacteraceae bacterium CHB4]